MCCNCPQQAEHPLRQMLLRCAGDALCRSSHRSNSWARALEEYRREGSAGINNIHGRMVARDEDIERELNDAEAQMRRIGHYLWELSNAEEEDLSRRNATRQKPSVFALSSLRAQPIWTSDLQSYVDLAQCNVDMIWEEYCAAKEKGVLLKEQIQRDVNEGGKWEAEYLLQEGRWHIDAVKEMPRLSNLLSKLPVMTNTGFGYVYFSTLYPGTNIRSHCGPTNLKLRLQLTMKAGGSSGRNLLEVAGMECDYQDGNAVIFDDSFQHSVSISSEASEPRIVLIVDLWHPSIPKGNSRVMATISSLFPPATDAVSSSHEAATHFVGSQNCCLAREVFVNLDKTPDFRATQNVKNNPEDKGYDMLVKFLLIGDSGCGKSSFLMRYSENTFTMSFMATIGVDFKIATEHYRNPKNEQITRVKLQIWDTAGPERFRTITSSYYRGAHGIFLCFDVTDHQTFETLRHWGSEIKKYAMPEVSVVMVGMKADVLPLEERPREVTFAEASALASELGVPYVECSSKDNYQVRDAVATLVHMIMEAKQAGRFEALERRQEEERNRRMAAVAQQSRHRCLVL